MEEEKKKNRRKTKSTLKKSLLDQAEDLENEMKSLLINIEKEKERLKELVENRNFLVGKNYEQEELTIREYKQILKARENQKEMLQKDNFEEILGGKINEKK